MNGAPRTAPVLLRLIIPIALAAIVVALAVPTLLIAMIDLSPEQASYIERSFALGSATTVLLLAIGLRVALRGVAGAAASDAFAQRRVLRLPVRTAGFGALIGVSATFLAALLRLRVAQDPATLIFGIAISTAALVGFLAVPLYIRVRAELRPHALFFARESLPPGRRVPIGFLVGYTVLAIAALAIAPASVFGTARLAAAKEQTTREHARATARRLARAVSTLPPSEAVRVCTHARLEHAVALVRLPSGQVVPEERAALLGEAPPEESPMEGDLRGGAVLVIAHPEEGSRAPLFLVVLALVGLATLLSLSLTRALYRDARGVTEQVAALAEGRRPPGVPTVTSSEIRRVTLALNRLLERIPRLQLEKFLAVERADESRRLKSMFLANMSHDLRSPLNSILGFSELLTRGLEGPITDGQRELLDDIHLTGSHLLRLLSEILDTARAESGHLDLDRRSAPLATLVTQARKEALRGRPESAAERIEVNLQAGLQPAHVDGLRMQQALTHVLDWALDAAHGRPLRVDIADRERRKGRVLVIEVMCDRPATLEEEDQLFQPFRKVEGVPGLHLALPLARRIVEAHGGTMEPYGTVEQATTPPPADATRHLGVRIVLPRVDPSRGGRRLPSR